MLFHHRAGNGCRAWIRTTISGFKARHPTLGRLGKLVLVNRKARMGRNPATGEAIKIPAKRVVKFRVAKAAKDAILGAR